MTESASEFTHRPEPLLQPASVLFVSAAGRPGGAERSLELLIRSLDPDGTMTALVSPTEGMSPGALESVGVRRFRTCAFEPVRRPGLLQAVGLGWRWISSMIVVLRAIITVRPEIVHANTTSAMLVSLLPAWLTRRPLFWHVRDMTPLDKLVRLCGRMASAIVAVSETVREHLAAQGIATGKTCVVCNGVDPSFGQGLSQAEARRDLRARFGFPPDSFVFVNVGQFTAWKRQDLFLRAAAEVARQCERARFLIVGGEPCGNDPGCRRELEELARETELSQKTAILGWQETIEAVLAAADAMVHTADAEPFGRVIIEALQVSLPVVAVRSGGPAEIIQEEQSGLLAEPGDIDGLVSLMLRVQRDGDLAQRLAAGGRRRVQADFTAERSTQSIRAVYQRILTAGAKE